jgi:hypothetical protein
MICDKCSNGIIEVAVHPIKHGKLTMLAPCKYCENGKSFLYHSLCDSDNQDCCDFSKILKDYKETHKR